MFRHVDRFLSETTDANREQPVGYDVHNVSRHKREIWHGRGKVVLKETKDGRRY